MTSLGTHEHWDDSLHKHYSRNLGTGDGIELVALSPTTGVGEEPSMAGQPAEATLLQNYPNPFNPTTTISFRLAARHDVRLAVFDLLGTEVSVLVGGTLEQGMHTVLFSGSGLPSGVYLCRLEAGGHSVTKKLLLLR